MRLISVITTFLLTTLSFAAPDPAAEQVKKELQDLFEISKQVNAGGDSQKKARQKLESYMDWNRIAQDCLGKATWKKTGESQRTEFQSLLKEVIIKTAYSRLDTFWKDTTYKFDMVTVKGKEAEAKAKFIVKGEEFSLDYYLEKTPARWIIFDIAYDGVRYSSNINEQLDVFLKEKNFAHLLDKLRKRKQELDSPAKPKKS